MPDFLTKLTPDQRRRLRREGIVLADKLVNSDSIEEGAKVLAAYRQKYGASDDNYLRYGLAELFLSDLLSKCCRHQARKVSYLLDEHLTDCGSVEMHRLLRENQLNMFRRFGDTDGETTCRRRLKAIHEQR